MMKSTRLFRIGLMVVSILLCMNEAIAKNDTPVPNFTGVILDKAEGAPIARAHIWVHEDAGKESFAAVPDHVGHFLIHLPDGYYDVLFSASGFAPFCKKVWVQKGKVITLEVHLEPDMDTSQVD